MIPKTLKVGLCVIVQEILNHCFQQFRYFTDMFLTISDNKRFTISSFINPFQSRVAFHIETSLFILNQITGFCIEFKTGLKWIKQSSQTLAASLTSMSWFEEPLLVLETESSQFYIAAIISGFKDAEGNVIIWEGCIVNNTNLIGHLDFSTTMVTTNFPIFTCISIFWLNL